jgi:hypothetical protein
MADYCSLAPSVARDSTRNPCKNIMANRTMIGEKSIPIPDMGTSCRIRCRTGSVILYKN